MSAWLGRNWGVTASAALVAAIVAWFIWPEKAPTPPPPLSAPVLRGDIEEVVAARGTVEPGRLVEVGVRVSGQLNKLHVKLGDLVSEGELLAEIDDLIQVSQVASAQAQLESLVARTSLIQANLELEQNNLQRQKRLMAAQATTQVEYDRAVVQLAQAENTLETHQLQIEQARAELDEAQALLNFTRIRAPAGGTIVNVLAEEGQMLNAGQVTPVILKIGDLRTIRIIAKIAEVDMDRLAPGMEAYLTTLRGGERRWDARLKEVSPLPSSDATGETVYFDALLEVDNPDGALLPGISTRVFFLTAVARNVLKVPLGALAYEGDSAPVSASQQYFSNGTGPDQPRISLPTEQVRNEEPDRNNGTMMAETATSPSATVRVVLGDGVVESRRVRIGVSNAVEAEVLSGLKGGDKVVVGSALPSAG